MKIKFISISDGQTVKFESQVLNYTDNSYEIIDKSLEDTNLCINILENKISFKRYGKTNMSISYILNEKSNGTYENDMGLFFNFDVFTKKLMISKEKIIIHYDFYIDNIFQGEFKIYILIN